MRRVGFLLAAAACIVLMVLAFAGPAAAHGAGGIEASNFETTLGGTIPSLPGVRVRLIETGERLELRNDGPDVVVLGARGEPYLRVGPDGTFENRRSPTVLLNQPDAHEPASAGPPTPPDWRKLSDAPVARWRDHRTHWTAASDPPEVARSPAERHVVFPRWEVGLEQGGVKAVVFGQLTWVPAPSPAPWYGLMAGALIGAAALGLLRRWGPGLAAATLGLLVLDVVHAFSVAFASPGGLGSHLAKVVTGGFYGIVGWVLAAVAIRLLARGKVDGLYAGVFAGLSIAVFGGLLDLATLSRSVTPSALPIGVARLCVALTAGGGFGLAAACLLVIQRTPAARRVVGGYPEDHPDEAGDGSVDDPTGPAGGRPVAPHGVGSEAERTS